MNKLRRKSLQVLSEKLDELKSELEDIQQQEEEYRDNIPENLQGSGRYDKADSACSDLFDAVSSIEEALDSIESAIQ